jgi:succinate dehydrogenase/fumarate reductase flavoprotein subunit
MTNYWLPPKWNKETDIVIIGCGAAGATAAITAAEAGSKVLILEKAPETGGSSSTSSGGLRNTVNASQAASFIKHIGLGAIDDDTAQTFAETWTEMKPWLTKHGAKYGGSDAVPPLASGLGEPEIFDIFFLKSREGFPRGCGKDFFALLEDNVRKLDIELMLSTPVKRLIQNPATREICGVVAENKEADIFIKAKKAVIMMCGGFAGNQEMLTTYIEEAPIKMYPTGTPYCTGDGIKMVIDIGADLWHMNAIEWAPHSFKVEEMPAAFWLQPKAQNWISVNKYGKRFRDESTSFAHTKRHLEVFDFEDDNEGHADWPNSTWYLVFDEKVRQAGPLVLTERMVGSPRSITYNSSRELYTWSQDNSVEITKGWIKKADSIKELAQLIKVDPATLNGTLTRYNKHCTEASDNEYNRKPQTLAPIDTPPFYAIESSVGIINTQGGPRRNAKSQVLSALSGSPIPRLYAGGEFGSIWGILYPGGCNLAECVVSGIISGRHAAAETPWE